MSINIILAIAITVILVILALICFRLSNVYEHFEMISIILLMSITMNIIAIDLTFILGENYLWVSAVFFLTTNLLSLITQLFYWKNKEREKLNERL